MKPKTKELAILALFAMCQKRESLVTSLEYKIRFKREANERAASAGAATRTANELTALMNDLVDAKEKLDEAQAALEDLRASE